MKNIWYWILAIFKVLFKPRKAKEEIVKYNTDLLRKLAPVYVRGRYGRSKSHNNRKRKNIQVIRIGKRSKIIKHA